MTRKAIIGVCGDSNPPPNDIRLQMAERLGRKLIDSGYRIITGGLGGIMEAASKGARSSKNHQNGDIIGILPGFEPEDANEYVDVPIATGLDHVRNQIVANSDALVAMGGGAGTLSEIAFGWMLKRLIIAYEVRGWSGKLANTRIDERIRYENIKDDRIYGVKTEDEVIEILDDLLPLYIKRRHGVRNRNVKR
jgi:uncharacterized protein (TIGR00725 family)